jgi:hypothetical protein
MKKKQSTTIERTRSDERKKQEIDVEISLLLAGTQSTFTHQKNNKQVFSLIHGTATNAIFY